MKTTLPLGLYVLSLTLVACANLSSVNLGAEYPTTAAIELDYRRQIETDRQEFAKMTVEQRAKFDKVDTEDLSLQKTMARIGPAVRQRELTRLLSSPLSLIDQNGWGLNFDGILAKTFIVRLIANDDFSTLGRLLATNCPPIGIEVYLASAKRPDGMLALIKAFGNAGNNPSAKNVLLCLKHAFPSLIEPGEADDIFVKRVDEWWEANYSRCEINHAYLGFPAAFQVNNTPEVDLFLIPPQPVKN